MYYDRLVDDGDRKWTIECVMDIVQKHLKENFHSLFEHLDSNSDGKVCMNQFFSHFAELIVSYYYRY